MLHILIIWEKALDKKDYILDDINKSFIIQRIFKFHWDAELFLKNYTVFYAHSLKHLSRKNLNRILTNKISHCGNGDFYVIVFEDPSPNLQLRKTSSGNRLVNINVFDKKTEYRQLTGGGHRIHSSDDVWETNKDLTLLFGLNTEDFCNQYRESVTEEIPISHNCIGVGGYASIQQLFYVLNNTIKYCVLRNHECLPDQYTVEGHGDIDLLVEDKNYMSYLTLARPIFPESYRVYHTISIARENIPFDFRYVGDNYYDQPWEEHILANRKLKEDLFYIPNDEDQFYTLLYHAYIQKREVKADYLPKLSLYAEKINKTFSPDIEASIKQLDSFLNKNRFEYIRPIDKTVIYNSKNISLSKYAWRYGQLIKRLDVNTSDDNHFHSRVYEKKESFTKIGTNWLIHNEAFYLQKLDNLEGFPKVLKEIRDDDNNESIIEITRVKGINFHRYFSNVHHQRKKHVKSFVLGALDLLNKLYTQDISHRDFLPENLIISEWNKRCSVSLIDFGWATDIENTNVNRPPNLAGRFISSKNATDSYTLGMFLLDYWYDLPYIRLISKLLRDISFDDYLTESIFKKKMKKISALAHIAFTPYDEWRLLCRRHNRIGKTIKSIKKTLES